MTRRLVAIAFASAAPVGYDTTGNFLSVEELP
jgi:hypothetical protein